MIEPSIEEMKAKLDIYERYYGPIPDGKAMTFCLRIREIAKVRGYSQRDLAKVLGKEESHVSKILMGKAPPSFSTLLEMEEKLDAEIITVSTAPIPPYQRITKRKEGESNGRIM